MFQLHPSAVNSFNEKANNILEGIGKHIGKRSEVERFENEVFIAAEIRNEDIIGDIRATSIDWEGKPIAKNFIVDNKEYVIDGESLEQFASLIETIHSKPVFSEKVSRIFIEETYISWLQLKMGKMTGIEIEPFIEFLIKYAAIAIKPVTVLVPLANIFVEREFDFCGATIENIDANFFDEMVLKVSEVDANFRENYLQHIQKLRQKYQGFSCVKVELECELSIAKQSAIETAMRISDLLGIFSNAMIVPDLKITAKVKGCEIVESASVFYISDKEARYGTEILDARSADIFAISCGDLADFRSCGLDILSELAAKSNLNDFEAAVLNMAYLYSKAAFTSDPMSKLVYTLSSLESMLLKSELEPIQQNLADRIAIFSTQGLTERKRIVENVKKVYGLRSKYLHHGRSASDTKELLSFFMSIKVFFITLLGNINNFKTKAEFLTFVDDKKYS